METRAALRAIHRILVNARFFTGNGESHGTLSSILDAIEYLPEMLLRPAEFDLFRLTLEGLAEKDPRFTGILEAFDQTIGCAAASMSGRVYANLGRQHSPRPRNE